MKSSEANNYVVTSPSAVIESEFLDCKVFRYVKPTHVDDEELSNEAFQLRENRSPPEEYISFYKSSKESIQEKLVDVESIMTSTNFTFKKNGGLLSLCTAEAKAEINKTRKIIDFINKRMPQKVGMHYLSKDVTDITEAKTMLVYLSDYYPKSCF